MGQVLVVDDDEPTRALLRATLEGDGWEVIEAADGLAAITKLSCSDPDVVVLDIMMPKLDGIALLGHLRNEARWSKLPIVMLSAKESPLDRAVSDRLGATDFITKPPDPEALTPRLLAAING